MILFDSPKALVWGDLDLPLFGLGADWFGDRFQPAVGFALAKDAERLWFLASHTAPALLHPQARPGKFQPELWKYDVAELFLADPKSGRYLELNLSPNGAWWSCEFTAPRVRDAARNEPMPDVQTYYELAPSGGWIAAMSIALDVLEARIDFGPETKGNVAFILGSPAQRFLTATKLGDGPPDYHLPQLFPTLQPQPIPDF